MATEQSNLNITITGEDKFTPVVQRFESGLIRAVGAISSAIATLSTISFPISQAAALEREMANVAKTTQFSAQQIKNLTRELAQLSLTTDTSAVDLAKIAAAAGQQGLGREGVEGIRQFTESVARMASVLDLTAEDAGRSIGKILNIFQIPLRDVEKTVSSINQISNNSTARANELINVLRRLGDAGGSLKFTQALALSATALDLGATPEVAGTTLAKFESALKVRNKEFSELLGKSRDTLAQEASEDGFKVFTEVLVALNKLTLKDREATVTRLFGGGRINSLADKFLQDSLRASPLLTKNLSQAEAGEKSGTSAIREQQTVLQTFTKQVEILTNSFKELGRQAGEGLLLPLTGYVAQLREALQQPGVRSFVTAIVQAFGQFAKVVVDTTKFIADLGINWENFITVFKVVAIVKMVEAFQKLAGTIPGVSASIALLTGASKANAAEGVAGRTQEITAWGALKLAIDRATGSWKSYTEAKRAAALADGNFQLKEKAAIDAQARQALLQKDADAKRLSAKVATNNLGLAQTDLSAAKQNAGKALIQADALAQQALRDAQTIGQKKLEAAEREHQARLALIRQEFRGVRTNVEKATRDGILASEEAFYTRQMAALRAADARRIAQAQVTAQAIVGIAGQQAKQEIAIAEAKVAQQQALANAATASSNAAGAAVLGAAGASAAARAAAEQARTASADNLTRLQRAKAIAVDAFTGIQRAMGLLTAGLGFLMKIAGPVVFWLTAIYTVLDLLGVADKLPGLFQRLTDALGFTSKAARDKAEADKALHEQHVQQKKDLDDLIERYGKLKDAQTGVLDVNKVTEIRGDFETSRTAQDFQNAATKLALLIDGQSEEQRRAEENLKRLPAVYQDVVRQISEQEKKIADLRDSIARAPKVTGAAAIGVAQGGSIINVPALEADLTKAENKLKELRKTAENVGPGISQGLKNTLPNIKKDGETINAIIASLFTPQSVKLLETFGPEVSALKKELNTLTEERKKAETDLSQSTDEASKTRAQNAIATLDTQIDGQKAAIESKMQAIRNALLAVANDKSISDATKATTTGVLALLALDTKILETFLIRLGDVKRSAQEFTGAGIDPKKLGKPVPPGTQSSGVLGEDSANKEARRLIKARADLEKAANEADRARARQHNDELLDANRRFFERGLLDLRTYYENKERLDTENLQADLTRVLEDIKVKQRERTQSDLKESDRVRIDAEVKSLEGQRDVIEAKIAALPGQMEAALDKEMKAFNEGVISDKIDLIRVLGFSEFDEALTLQFDLVASQIKEKIARLQQELAKGTPGVTQALIDGLQLNALVNSLDPVLQLIADRVRLASDAIANATRKIELDRDDGKLTDREAESLTNKARAAEAETVRQQILEINRLREALSRKVAEEARANEQSEDGAVAALRQTDAWKEQENQIDSLTLRYRELTKAANEVARTINQSIEDGLATSIENFANGTERSLRAMVVNFAKGLAQDVNRILARDLAQSVVKDFLGGGGTGGIGKFFSELFGFGTPGDQQLIDKDLLGRDAGHAMYVQLVEGSQTSEKAKPLGGLLGKLFGNKDEALDVSDQVPLPDLDPAGAESLKPEDFSQQARDTLRSVSEVAGDVLDTAESLFEGLSTEIEPGLTSFTDLLLSNFSDLFSELGQDIGDWSEALSATISEIFSEMASENNSSSGNSGGMWASFASWFSQAFSSSHTGGLVGSPTQRRDKFLSPLVFANAVRYHSGGIAGLQPDEVPTILKKGEEVLTAGDPRHRNNGGVPMTSPRVNVVINTPDADSFRRSKDQIAATMGVAMNRAVRRNR